MIEMNINKMSENVKDWHSWHLKIPDGGQTWLKQVHLSGASIPPPTPPALLWDKCPLHPPPCPLAHANNNLWKKYP